MNHQKILITGVTGQVAFPFALHHAENNEVWAIARFGDTDKRTALEAAGVHCRVVDLCDGEYGDLPTDFDAVFHFAVARIKEDDFELELTANAEATGKLMSYCRDAKAFFHCSTSGVYQSVGHDLLTETSSLGDNHRAMMPTYSIGKIAVEAVVRFCAQEYNLPTVIARLNTPYGESGWPFYHLMMMQHNIDIAVHSDGPSEYTLIHQDDINRLAPKFLAHASVPAEIFNLSGQEHVSIEEWVAYIESLTGLTAKFKVTSDTLESVKTDNTKMCQAIGPATVTWQDGIRAMVEKAGALKG